MAEAVVWLQERCARVCVVGRCMYRCRPGGTVLSAECGIGGERLGVDADRPVGRLDYRFVVVGCSDCEFRFSV